ncbi:MAG: alpha/beta fold hydrolase [Cellvibrionaceae bacterium]
MNYKKQKINTNLGIINVHITGDGPTMICWPSLMMTGLMWESQVKYFSKSHTMILVDSPGHGESEALQAVFSMRDCALCLSQILDELDVNECVFVGNSWGGMMGGVFAALYPSKLKAAVLMNCTASEASDLQKEEYAKTLSVIRSLEVFPEGLIGYSVKAFVGKTTEKTKPEVVEFISAMLKKVNPQSVSWAIESVVPLRKNQLSLLNTIVKPVLVITGEEDRTFPVDETKTMADSIPGSNFKVFPKVGHLSALESPNIVNNEIEKFLASIE